MSIDQYLRGSLANSLHAFLPSPDQWFDRPEDAEIWVSIFRVFRVPYDTQEPTGIVAEFGQVRAVLTNANIPYFNFAYGFNPKPDGTVEPKAELIGWEATNRGNLLLLMTPLKSDDQQVDPETAAHYRIDSARAVMVGVMGLNVAFEQVCDFAVSNQGDSSRTGISRRSPAMENPAFYPVPELDDWSYLQVTQILQMIDLLDEATGNRVRLALRWYQRALGERRVLKLGAGNVDTLINYWIALETLARVGEQKVVGTLIKALSQIHGRTTQEIGQTFPISQVYRRRKEIIHEGQLMSGVSFELQQFLSDVFMDVLVHDVMKLAGSPRTRKYLDGRAYGFL